MHSAKSFRLHSLVALLMIGYCASFLPESFASKKKHDIPIVSVNVRDKDLDEVLEDISNTSGYDIILNSENDNLSVNLKLDNAALDVVIKRLLKDVNYTVVWDDISRRILLSVYGRQDADIQSQGPAMVSGQKLNQVNTPQQAKNRASPFPLPFSGPNGKPIRHTIKRGGRPAVNLSGRQTRFAQSTSTIR